VLALLRRRDFGLLWTSGLISIAGDWVLFAALPYFVYARTGSTIATAGMTVATLAPGVLLSSVGGVFADRVDRKRLLVAGNLLQAGAASLLLLVPGGGWLGFVYVAAAAESALASFTVPAESALLPTLVEDYEFVRANSLNALNKRIGRVAGLPLGGLLLGFAGLRGVVLVDCATFVAAALLVSLIRAPQQPGEPALEEAAAAVTTFWEQWLDGLRLVRSRRSVALLFVIFGVMTFGGTMLDPPYPAWARDVLHLGPEGYAALLTTSAVTGILGALLMGRFGDRFEPRTVMGWGSVVAGAMLLVKYNVASVPLTFVLVALGGVVSVASAVAVETLIQQTVEDRYRGRVYGSLGASGSLLSLAGAATGGVVAQTVGIVPALTLASALVLVAGVIVLVGTPSPAAAEVLVRLHVEPHREERELRAEDQEQRHEHDGRGCDRVAERALDDHRDPEP
jgi:MFS family permease